MIQTITQNNAPNILKQIVKQKIKDVAKDKKIISLIEIKNQTSIIKKSANFYNNLQKKVNKKQNAVIAEIKKASPSKGVLRQNFDPKQIAKDYKQAGATCISVLTDKKFFQGSDDYLSQVVEAIDLPVLRKDFVIDEYQIYQAKALGADCILLIVAILTAVQMQNFIKIAKNINLDILVEVHNEQELNEALKLDLSMIGINNRNLCDFSVSLTTTLELMQKIDDKLIITESGILTQDDVKLMNNNNIYGFLVGEAFMREDSIVAGFHKIFN